MIFCQQNRRNKQMQKFYQQKSFYRIITWNTQLTFKDLLDEEITMTHSLQSTWDYTNVPLKQHRQSRQGDWICLKCNNLNFSFRKKCNRCKAQTRQENEQHIRQAYQYYHEYYQQFNQIQSLDHKTLHTSDHQKFASIRKDSFSPSSASEEASDDSFEETNLPSVSPIIKRYNKERGTPKTQISQGSSDEQCNQGKEYLQQYCWKNILIDEETENQFSSRQNYDYWDIQIQKIVQNIVI